MRGRPVAEVFSAIEDRGGVAIPSHPYDHWRPEFPKTFSIGLILRRLKSSTPPARKDFNEQALAYATGRDLSMTASSDAHHASAVAVSFTHFELEDLNLAELLRAVRKGGTPEGHYLSMREAMKKQFSALLRPGNRKPA